MSFKVTGENIYFRKLQEADLATLMSAVDFNAYGQVPNDNENKYTWYTENKFNEAAVSSGLASDSMGRMFLTICKKSDDSIIGYHILEYLPEKRIESIFSAIITAARNGNFYKEAGILRHKFYFEGLQAISCLLYTSPSPRD